MEKERVLENLYAIVGKENVLEDDSTRNQKAKDLYALRIFQKHVGWEPMLPDVVVQPSNTEEVSKILSFCNDNDIPVIPYGGGSGVLGGTETVKEGTVVIDLDKFDKVLSVNEQNLSITCQAGVYIKDLESYVIDKGYILGHYPQSMDLAQWVG